MKLLDFLLNYSRLFNRSLCFTLIFHWGHFSTVETFSADDQKVCRLFWKMYKVWMNRDHVKNQYTNYCVCVPVTNLFFHSFSFRFPILSKLFVKFWLLFLAAPVKPLYFQAVAQLKEKEKEREDRKKSKKKNVKFTDNQVENVPCEKTP